MSYFYIYLDWSMRYFDPILNFEMHYTPRGIPTIIGRIVAENGRPYSIHYSYDGSWENQ